MRYLIVAAGMRLLCQTARSQDNSSTVDKAINFPGHFFPDIHRKASLPKNRLDPQTEKLLHRPLKKAIDFLYQLSAATVSG